MTRCAPLPPHFVWSPRLVFTGKEKSPQPASRCRARIVDASHRHSFLLRTASAGRAYALPDGGGRIFSLSPKNHARYFQFHNFQSPVTQSGQAVCHLPPRCWRACQPFFLAAAHNALKSGGLPILSSSSKRAPQTSHTKAILPLCLSMVITRLFGSPRHGRRIMDCRKKSGNDEPITSCPH
jgi:hypothetical protein